MIDHRPPQRASSQDIGIGLLGSMSVWHWAIVLVLIIILFGRGRISALMGDLAGGIKSFRKNIAEDDATPAAKLESSSPRPMETAAKDQQSHPGQA